MLPKPFLKEGIASLTSLISTLVLLLGLAAAAFLVQNQQEVREKAAPQPCRVCHGLSNCVEIEIPPYCNAGENECFENADCVLTPTPTPGACTVSYENRGCGRNNCAQTSMWQLVTNADCSTTSRCVPNHSDCVLTTTPTPTTGACTVSYENRGCGRNNCSQTSMWQLVTNADCTATSR